jgi:hypothetical protein
MITTSEHIYIYDIRNKYLIRKTTKWSTYAYKYSNYKLYFIYQYRIIFHEFKFVNLLSSYFKYPLLQKETFFEEDKFNHKISLLQIFRNVT